MKTIRSILGTGLMLFTMNVSAAPEKKGVDAHGGSSVLCTLANGSQTAESFDRYEGIEMAGLTPDLGAATLTYEQKVEIFLSRVEARDVLRAERYRKIYELFKTSSSFVQRSFIKEISDATTYITPSGNCVKIQAAIQRHQVGLFEKHFLFDAAIWQLMDAESKAMLVQHEIVYFDEVEYMKKFEGSVLNPYSEYKSDGSRLYNQILSSQHGNALTQDDYVTVVNQNLTNKAITVKLFGAIVYYDKAKLAQFSGFLAREFTSPIIKGNSICPLYNNNLITFSAAGILQGCTNQSYLIPLTVLGHPNASAIAPLLPKSVVFDSNGNLTAGVLEDDVTFTLSNGNPFLCKSASVVKFKNGFVQSCGMSKVTLKDEFGQDWICYSPEFYDSGAIMNCINKPSSDKAPEYKVPGLSSTFGGCTTFTFFESGKLKACSSSTGNFKSSIVLFGKALNVETKGSVSFTEDGFFIGRFVIKPEVPFSRTQVNTVDGPLEIDLSYSRTEPGGLKTEKITTVDMNAVGLVSRVQVQVYKYNPKPADAHWILYSDEVVYEHQ